MRAQVLYVPEQVLLDLSDPDLGHAEGHAILLRHWRQGAQRRPEFHRDNPAFVCVTHVGGTNPGLYLKQSGGEWFAAHYESGICKDLRIPSAMSDEHKRQTEYWARAAEDAGWSVALEQSLGTGTRPDALISGGSVLVGVEVQRSSMTAVSAVHRTRRAMAAGVLDVWFTGSDIKTVGRKTTPVWAHRVPTAGAQEIAWKILPARRAAVATGLRVVSARRCVVGNFDRCPVSGRGRFCGKPHPVNEPWRGLTVDDVAAMVPAGEIIPIRFRRANGRDDVLLVSPESVALYQELTGRSAVVSFHPQSEMLPPPRPTSVIECANEQLTAQLPLFTLPRGRLEVRAAEPAQRRAVTRAAAVGVCADCNVSRVPPGQEFCQACRLLAKMRGGRT